MGSSYLISPSSIYRHTYFQHCYTIKTWYESLSEHTFTTEFISLSAEEVCAVKMNMYICMYMYVLCHLLSHAILPPYLPSPLPPSLPPPLPPSPPPSLPPSLPPPPPSLQVDVLLAASHPGQADQPELSDDQKELLEQIEKKLNDAIEKFEGDGGFIRVNDRYV